MYQHHSEVMDHMLGTRNESSEKGRQKKRNRRFSFPSKPQLQGKINWARDPYHN